MKTNLIYAAFALLFALQLLPVENPTIIRKQFLKTIC